MTARKATAGLLLLAALVLAAIAALTPLRSSEIAELDAEARRLGELWVEDQGNEALARESNEFFEQARDLEPPLRPFTALGGALLVGAAAVATWPPRRDEEPTATAQRQPEPA